MQWTTSETLTTTVDHNDIRLRSIEPDGGKSNPQVNDSNRPRAGSLQARGHQQSESEPSPAVVADASQGHDLVTCRAELAKLALFGRRSASRGRIRTSLDTRLTRPQCPHLLVGRKHWSTKGPTITPLEVTAIVIVPHPRQLTGQSAIEVHRIHDISDFRIHNLGTHATTIGHQQSARTAHC